MPVCVCRGTTCALSNEQHIHLMGLTFNQCTHSLSHLSKKNTTPASQETVCACTCVCDGPRGGAPAVDLLHPTITTHRWQEFQKWGKSLRPTRSPSSHKNTWITWISWISWLSLSCVTPHLTLQGPPVSLSYSFLFEMTSVVHAGSDEVPHCVRLGQDPSCFICSNFVYSKVWHLMK